MPVQISSIVTENTNSGMNTSSVFHSYQESSSQKTYKLEEFEKTQLEDVLNMCADYERQIEAEQKEALRLRQSSALSDITLESNHNDVNEGSTNSTRQSIEPSNVNSRPILPKITTIYEHGGCQQPSNLHPVTPTSPNGNQWSPGGTMITPNRIITNGSLPRDKRQTSPSPCNTPTLSRFMPSIANNNIHLNPSGTTQSPRLGLSGSGINTSNTNQSSDSYPPPSSPFLPATESELKSLFGFDVKNISEMFSPSDKTKDFERERSSEKDMTSKQNHLNLQIPSSTPARNTIRTSPNTQPMQQQNIHGKYRDCQDTVFNFTDDCNYQGGGEDIYGNGTSITTNHKSAGNMEAQNRNTFSVANQFSPSFASSDSSSPGSTAPRRPPRSKHDLALSVNGCSPASPNVMRKTNGETLTSTDDTLLPSKEAPNRLLIGTQMLQNNQNNKLMSNIPVVRQAPSRYQNNSNVAYYGRNGIQMSRDGQSDKTKENNQQDLIDSLNSKRKEQLTIVSTLKQKLLDLEQSEVEEIGELDFERSLIIGELDSENEQLRKIRSRLSLLRIQEQRLSGVFEEWQKVAALKMDEVEERILNAEDELKRLQEEYEKSKQRDTDNNVEDINRSPSDGEDLIERIKYHQELVDLERKTFEDMEFHQMEEEAHKQTEREDLLKEIGELEKEVKRHESQLSDLEEQQKKILANVRKDTNNLEIQRQIVIRELEKERTKLNEIELKLNKISKPPSSIEDSNDFARPYANLSNYSNSLVNGDKNLNDQIDNIGLQIQGLSSSSNYSLSDDDDSLPFDGRLSNGQQEIIEKNIELEQSLKRLALLDKTQEEIEKISKAVIKLKMSSKPSNSNTDNHYNMTRSLTSPIPLDNELSSIKQSYKENGLIDEQIYSVISNRDDCDNARNAIEGVAELGDDKASNTKENMFTPRGGRKFSPDKIKGSPLLVLQQQKKIAEELNRVIKAMNNGGGEPVNNVLNNSIHDEPINPSNTSNQIQVSTKNLMINSLNSAGSDMEDSITGDSTSDIQTESLSSDDCPTSNGTEAKQMETNGNGESNIADSSSLSSNQTQSNEYQNTNTRLISNNKLAGKNDGTKGSMHNNHHNNSQYDDQSQSSRELSDEQLKNNPDQVLTLESRPISEASSFWDEAESRNEVKRRQQQLQHKQERPLTRYLPIRSDQLDLKTHIETAGHQLELAFPSVVVDSLTCRGYLHKLGSAAVSGNGRRSAGASSHGKFGVSTLGLGHSAWKKRWFVFDRSKKTLIYYSDKNESKAKGGVYFRAIEEVYVDHMNSAGSPNPKLTFAMKTFERTYYLMAPSPEAMRIWVDVIFTGAEGYQEFMHQ